MQRIYRLIHVSDMHFGDTFHETSACTPGLETHDHIAVAALSNEVKRTLLAHTPTSVVATGDLTTWGTPSAFDFAFQFLRNHIRIGRISHGLHQSDLPVIPGNHDIWNSQLWGGLAPTPQTVFQNHFNPPAPTAVYPGPGILFPYRLRLHAGPPAIYLYGLNSTEVELLPFPALQSALAYGFIGPQQLTDLKKLVASEPEPKEVPRIRIAAIHHPLAYQTRFAPPIKTLHGRAHVIKTLQELGFAIALGGHQHKGFTRLVQTSRHHEGLQVFSVGTSTQAECPSPSSSPSAGLMNEFRAYDFNIDLGDSHSLEVDVINYSYLPNQFTFAQNSQVEHIPFNLHRYP